VRLSYVQLLISLGRISRAENQLHELLKQEPSHMEARVALALLKIRTPNVRIDTRNIKAILGPLADPTQRSRLPSALITTLTSQ
jgi:hypothetical protein